MHTYIFSVKLINKEDRRKTRQETLKVNHHRLGDAWDKAEALCYDKYPNEEALLSLARA